LPGRISEGEALLHPQILNVLRLIRSKYPDKIIHISTNATMLTPDFIKKLIPYKPIKFTISYHSDNPGYWREIFNLGMDKFRIAKSAFLQLLKSGFLVEGAIVALPNLVGYADIEKTIEFMGCFTRRILIYAPGYSFKASADLKRKLDADYRQISRFLIKMRKKYKVDLDFQTDLLSPLVFSPISTMFDSFEKRFNNVLWIFSEAAFLKARKILSEWNDFVPNDHYAFMAKNNTYKGTIICSGLLMVSDYRKAIRKSLRELKKKKIKVDLIVLARNSFDSKGNDLMRKNYSKLSSEFKIPVWLR
jgi:hypothetical protein